MAAIFSETEIGNAQDLTGRKFNFLTVEGFGKRTRSKGGTHIFWRCRCVDGNSLLVEANKLRTGHTKSCGCHQRKRAAEAKFVHGFCKKRKEGEEHPAYTSYRAMMDRCYNPNHEAWKYYGGNTPPVTVCERWRGKPSVFLEDMLPTWKSGLTLDRKNPFGNYESTNCRWATHREQRLNQRKTYHV